MFDLKEIVAMEVVAKDKKKPKESKDGKVWFCSYGGSRSYGRYARTHQKTITSQLVVTSALYKAEVSSSSRSLPTFPIVRIYWLKYFLRLEQERNFFDSVSNFLSFGYCTRIYIWTVWYLDKLMPIAPHSTAYCKQNLSVSVAGRADIIEENHLWCLMS